MPTAIRQPHLDAPKGEIDARRAVAEITPARAPKAGTNASANLAAMAHAQNKIQASFMLPPFVVKLKRICPFRVFVSGTVACFTDSFAH